jgi:hypothetical protein
MRDVLGLYEEFFSSHRELATAGDTNAKVHVERVWDAFVKWAVDEQCHIGFRDLDSKRNKLMVWGAIVRDMRI